MSHPVDDALARIEARIRSLQDELARTRHERDRLAVENDRLRVEVTSLRAAKPPISELEGPLLDDDDWSRLVSDGH